MVLKHNELIIPQDDPFANCKLNRKQYALILSNIIQTYKDGFVLAISGQWGAGKSTFVKMWKQHLENNGYKTLYFNAWENDLLTDPTVAILGELKKLLNDNDEKTFKKILSIGATVTKKVLPALGKAVIERCFDEKIFSNTIENTIAATTDILEKEIQEYSKKKKGVEDFKALLSEYTKVTSPEKPIIFIIDELDRCRPTYAVEVLEKIKHFFSVNGIIFILSIDKEQLSNSIKGFYGSDCINGNEYLRRFIDIEYKLPEPDTKIFCKYLYNYFNFDDFLQNEDRLRTFKDKSEDEEFIKMASILACATKLTLRQIERLFAHSRLALKSFNHKEHVIPTLFFFLVYLRNHHSSMYDRIVSKQCSIQELATLLESILPITSSESYTESFVIAELLVFYEVYSQGYNLKTTSLIDKDDQKLTFNSKIQIEFMRRCIRHCETTYRGNDMLKPLFEKIELYNNLVS